MKKRLTSLILAVVTAAMTLTGCGTKASSENVFRVGMEAGYAPFNWTQQDDSNGAVKIEGSSEYAGGYDVEIAKKIADSLGKELVIVKTEWDGLVPSLTSGKIDAIIAGMSPTEERKETIDFSDIYYNSDLEKPDDMPKLPKYIQYRPRGPRYWKQSDIPALLAFKEWVPKGRSGVMGRINECFLR